ncbi:MAG: TonB family protein [Ignavibacteriales bacterium]|nr:TonB family protein [Ignavibacteriales bacterium]
MEPQEKIDTQQFIIDRLQDIHRKAEASNFAEALTAMKEVKAADAKNIYLIAIEKQIAKLNDPSLQAENRTAIIKSLPPMIDRAISDVQRRAVVPKEDSQKVQKEAALEKLKSQYFQRSDDYVEKKEYQRALEEIRRIYIIEPGSVVAKEYEKKIEQLAALQIRGESPAPQEEVVKESKTTIPIAEAREEEDKPAAKSNKPKILIMAAAAVVILLVGTWFILSKNSASKPSEQLTVQQPPVSQESATPTLPTTTTSTPQSGNEPAPIAEKSKEPAKVQKTTPEIKKPVTSEQKPVQTPATTQPIRTQTQPAQQPSQQPVVNTPSTQPPAQQQTKPAESTPAPMPFVAIESQPEFIHREPAVYPEIAKKMGLQGRVTVEVTIDAQGKPIQAKVVKSASDVFNEAAVEAVMKYTFKPAMMSTGPVSSKIMIPIDFRMSR